MSTLPATRSTKMPTNYVEAKKAVAQCVRVDECQKWANKAIALKAYAKQMKDTKLRDDAQRILDRAVRRGGELLAQVQKGNARRNASKNNSSNRNGVARDAGLSPAQATQMLRVAKVPEVEFEAAVEGNHPPSAKQLADKGTKHHEKPKPEPYRNEWIDWTSAVNHLASLPACGLEVLACRSPLEVKRLREDARRASDNLLLWCKQLEEVR